MNEILLQGISLEQLLERIDKLLDSRLMGNTTQKPPSQTHFLSRTEVAKLLKISLPTLHEWTKLEWLQSYKIGNRVLYKIDEIEEAIRKTTIQKHKRNIP